MHRIFLFESGTTGWGGSFKSCYLIANALRKREAFVAVGYLNSSNYWRKLEVDNFLIKEFSHKLYSKKIKNSFCNRLLRRLDKHTKILLSLFNNKIHNKFISEVVEFIKENNINLIHSNTNYIRDIEIFKLAKRMGLPIACHLRMEPCQKLTFFEKKIARYEKACFIAVSKAIRRKWIVAGLPKEKIKLIYNAQPQLNSIQMKNLVDYSDNFPVKILFVGRLSKIKGVDVLINALAGINKSSWRLSIVGDGDEKNELMKLAKNRGLKENIAFCGFQKTVEDFYINHNIVVVASRKESFGRVVIEAMQFGIPVVASNIDGPAEIIENGKDGILFDVDDINGLKKALEMLISNSDKRKEIGLAGKETQKQFSEEVFMNRLSDVYQWLLSEKSIK
jgi:glycosyltransferase involved in cell wall biosynthesis